MHDFEFFFALAIGSIYVVAFFCFEEDNELNINTMNIINSMSFFSFAVFCSSALLSPVIVLFPLFLHPFMSLPSLSFLFFLD